MAVSVTKSKITEAHALTELGGKGPAWPLQREIPFVSLLEGYEGVNERTHKGNPVAKYKQIFQNSLTSFPTKVKTGNSSCQGTGRKVLL